MSVVVTNTPYQADVEKAGSHLSGLDALRGVAAVGVLVLHGCYHFGLPHLLRHAYLAVDFFFMMSGFVLAHAYEDRLRAGLSLWTFLRQRMIRLYPMVVLGVAAGVVAESIGGTGWREIVIEAATGLAFLPSLIDATKSTDVFPIDPPLWSLLWELVASVVLATAIHSIPTRKIAIGSALCLCWLIYIGYQHGSLEVGYKVAHFTGGVARIGFSFTSGIILRRWWFLRPRRAPSLQIRWLAVSLMTFFAVPALPGLWMVDLLIIAVGFPLIILCAAGVDRVSVRWQVGAEMSYPLYLIHIPILAIVGAQCGAHTLFAREIWMIFAAASALLCSFLAARFWDVPVRRRITATSKRSSFRAAYGRSVALRTMR